MHYKAVSVDNGVVTLENLTHSVYNPMPKELKLDLSLLLDQLASANKVVETTEEASTSKAKKSSKA